MQTAADCVDVVVGNADEEQEEQNAEEDDETRDSDEESRCSESIGQYRREILESSVADSLRAERHVLAEFVQTNQANPLAARFVR